MAYGSVLTDTVQSSTSGTPPTFKDGNGTQVGTLCRAWVNFNGSGGITVNGSFNVSSVVRNGTGDYTINFTNSMPDANYSVTQSARPNTTGANTVQMRVFGYTNGNNQAPASSNFRVGFAVQNVNNAQDCDYVCLAVFR